MKKIIYIFLFVGMLYSWNILDKDHRYPTEETIIMGGLNDTDSVFMYSIDTLANYIGNIGVTHYDTLSVDSLITNTTLVSDTLRVGNIFKMHGNSNYWEFYGRNGGEKYQYYFYNGGISTNTLELYSDLEMSGTLGNINLRWGDGNSDTLRFGSANTWVGKIFMQDIDNRPYLTFENTNLIFNTKVNSLDSIKILNSASEIVACLDTLGNAYFGGNLHVDGYITKSEQHGIYAQLAVPDTLICTTANVFQPLIGTYTNYPKKGFTLGTDYIQCHTADSVYFIIDIQASYRQQDVGRSMAVGAALNGETINYQTDGVNPSFAKNAGELYQTRFRRVLELIEGDEIQIQFTSDANSDEVIFENLTATIQEFMSK